MKPSVAFLGTGLMGAPMARNLLKSGFALQVWNRSPAKAQALITDGATFCATAAEAVAGADYVITMLSDGTATGQMTADPAITGGLKKGAVWLDMSSIKPAEAREQAAHLTSLGFGYLDAPVSGGTKGAEAASLAIMAGGDLTVFDRAVPVFSAMGRPVHVGPTGSGQLAKLANQAIVAATIGVVAEAMLLIEEGGADPAAVRQALKGGFADSIILQQHGERMTERNFVPGGPSKFQLKDINNLLGEAQALGLELPVSQHIQNRFARFCSDLNGADLDHSGLYLELRDLNNMKET